MTMNCYSFAVSTVATALFMASNIQQVHSHGYLYQPESRNYVAKVDGREGSRSGVPKAEYCAHCLNRNNGLCGTNGAADYDQWLDSTGQPMPWDSHSIYQQGSTITVKSWLAVHHGGHMEMKACPMGRDATQACMDDHLLTFVSDNIYGMPSDSQYPERGYYFGGAGWSGSEFDMTFKLPDNLVGGKVLVQWRYITANSCNPPGYANYFARNNLPDIHWSRVLSNCPFPIPLDGDISKGPEQFFSCAEVTVMPNGGFPQVTPAPAPPTIVVTNPPVLPITSSSEDTANPNCKSCAVGSVGPCQNADGACFAYRDAVNKLCWPGSVDCNAVVADSPTKSPTVRPTEQPVTSNPTRQPTKSPTVRPTEQPVTVNPTMLPTEQPVTANPTRQPTVRPTEQPVTANPTTQPTLRPTEQPVTSNPTKLPTVRPTEQPVTFNPSTQPTSRPTEQPVTTNPTRLPTRSPTEQPATANPTKLPTVRPTEQPVTANPTKLPTVRPTLLPTVLPTEQPVTSNPTKLPTRSPTESPTRLRTRKPTTAPTVSPTSTPETQPPEEPKCPPCYFGTSGDCQQSNTVCWPYMDEATKTCYPGTIDCASL